MVGKMVICVNASDNEWGTLTEGKEYEVLFENSMHYSVEEEGGYKFWYEKSRFARVRIDLEGWAIW